MQQKANMARKDLHELIFLGSVCRAVLNFLWKPYMTFDRENQTSSVKGLLGDC